jgi:hypothetical protein
MAGVPTSVVAPGSGPPSLCELEPRQPSSTSAEFEKRLYLDQLTPMSVYGHLLLPAVVQRLQFLHVKCAELNIPEEVT